MARILVEVPDPLDLETPPAGRHPLITGSYVRVEIPGRPLEGTLPMARAWLRHGDVVWVANAEDKLEIREIRCQWRGRSSVCVADGLLPGDRVITTDLGAPVAGMALEIRERDAAEVTR
jgi:hypothetical protein